MRFSTTGNIRRVLLVNDRYNLLPELSDFFEKEREGLMVDFLRTFGGMTLSVPALDTLDRAERDVDIWESVDRDPTFKTICFLAEQYSMDENSVLRAYKRVCAQLKEPVKYGEEPK